MNPRDFCSLAHTLVQEARNKPSPVRCRTAISRAYFAAYNVAIEILSNMNIYILGQGGDKHVIVREYLNNSGDQSIKAAKKELNDLHENRKASDYLDYKLKNFDPENPTTALSCVKVASSIIKRLDACSLDQKIVKALKEHHRLRTTGSN